MLDIEASKSNLYVEIGKAIINYTQAAAAQVNALRDLHVAETRHAALRSHVAIRVAEHGEKEGKKYSLDRIQQYVDIEAEVLASQQAVLQAKIAYDEAVACVKIVENSYKGYHDMVKLLAAIVPLTHK